MLLALGPPTALFAAVHTGIVTHRGKPVPGATVTLTQGERRIVTTSDAQSTGRAFRRWRVGEVQDRRWRGEGERHLTHAADPQHLTSSRPFRLGRTNALTSVSASRIRRHYEPRHCSWWLLH